MDKTIRLHAIGNDVSARAAVRPSSLIEQLASDVAARDAFRLASRVARSWPKQWLDRHPEVKAKPEMAVLVIYEELCLREERGEEVDSAELYRAFSAVSRRFKRRPLLPSLDACRPGTVFPRPARSSASSACCASWAAAAPGGFFWRPSPCSPIGPWSSS